MLYCCSKACVIPELGSVIVKRGKLLKSEHSMGICTFISPPSDTFTINPNMINVMFKELCVRKYFGCINWDYFATPQILLLLLYSALLRLLLVDNLYLYFVVFNHGFLPVECLCKMAEKPSLSALKAANKILKHWRCFYSSVDSAHAVCLYHVCISDKIQHQTRQITQEYKVNQK